MPTRRIYRGLRRRKTAVVAMIAAQALAGACTKDKRDQAVPVDAFSQVPRTVLNERALKGGWPFQWIQDTNRNGTVDARELAVLWGTDDSASAWTTGRELTPRFVEAYSTLVREPLAARDERGRLVEKELSSSLPTIVFTDLSDAPAVDQAIVRQVGEVARRLERVFMRQLGSARFVDRARKLKGRDRALFFLNQSPWCLRGTSGNKGCGAFEDLPQRVSGLYPAELQKDKGYCKTLAERPDAETLFDRHTAVVQRDGKLEAVPYSKAYRTEMTEVAKALRALAALVRDPAEAAFRNYVLASAQAFENDDWPSADRAWLELTTQSSQWYLRIGPDRVASLYAPCRRKALFQLTFGRFDRRSNTWKKKMALVKDKMEAKMTALAGAPYAQRDVDLGVPDFVHIILNAGETRRPVGAYIANTLPDAGPIADAGRRRTVSFNNLFTDPDSRARLESGVKDYFCPDSAWRFSSDPEPRVINSIFFLAGRNVGPTDDYRVRGRSQAEIFGGSMARVLNQVKGQASALHFVRWLKGRELIEPQLAERSFASGVMWSMQNLVQSLFAADGSRTVAGHIGAVMMGALLKGGAVQWRSDMAPASGSDKGCLSVYFDRFDEPVEQLLTEVVRIKARGNVDALDALLKRYVDEGPKDVFKVIRERMRRRPGTTFVYAFRTGGRS